MAKKKEIKNIEELLGEALITKEEQPYEIPSNWEWVRLGNIGDWGSGGTPSRKDQSFYQNGTIPWLKTGDLNNGIVDEVDEYITEEAVKKSSAKLFPKNSIGIAMYGATIGKLGIFGKEMTTNQACGVIVVNKDLVENKGLFYYLLSQKENFIELGKGGAQPNISQTVLKEYPFPLPPLSEQTRIVNKLESMLSKIKEAKEKIVEAKESFELRRASILHKAFTGELTRQWREERAVNSEELTVNSLLEKINEEKIKAWEEECRKADLEGKKKPSKPKLKTVEEMKISDDEKPYDLPQGWEWVRLGDVALFQNGYAFKSDEFVEKGIQIVRMGNLYMNRFDLSRNPVYISENISKDIKEKYSIKNNDILLSLTGTKYKKDYGYAIFMTDINEPILLNQRILALRFSVILSRFAHSYLQTNIFRDKFFSFETGGVNQGNVGSSSVESIYFPLPPLSEQQEIVARIEALLKAEDEAKDLLNMEEQIDLLEKSILSKAFRGELGTNDTSDEPALELLKRVLGE